MAHDPNCKCCTEGPEAFRADLERRIKEYGHSVISTSADSPAGEVSLAYTVGLADANLPELMVFGLPAQAACVLLADAARMLREGKLPTDTRIEELASLPTIFKEVPPKIAEDFIVQANNRANRALPALQMVWPDRAGLFPWEPGADPRFAAAQPMLYQWSH